MAFRTIENRKGFSLIELVIVIVILGIITTILIPIMVSIYETANQATDNANARLIYNASAMWYSENNQPDADLTPAELKRYLGLTDFPPANSIAFTGTFSSAVDIQGKIIVRTSKPVTFDPSVGKLTP